MRYIKKGFSIIKEYGFKFFVCKLYRFIIAKSYSLYATIMDFRIGGISANVPKDSRYESLGAYRTESTNYVWLKKIFSCFPLGKDTTFIDVGCGEGRVLTYLYLKKYRNKMIGVELDKQVAKVAKARTKKCKNIEIVQGNILEHGELFKDANAVYLYNPFNEEIMTKFIEMIERNATRKVTMYYANDLYRNVIDKRENWYILRRNRVNSKVANKGCYTVYRYYPNDYFSEKNQ